MEQQHQEPPAGDSGDARPKIFQNVNTLIAGVTGLLIALGGLAAAWDKLPWARDKPAEQQQLAADAEPAAADADPAASDAAAADESADADEPDPVFYKTDEGGTLRKIDGLWVEADKAGNRFRYEEFSNDGVMIVGIDRGGGEQGEDVYLRWPNWGGQAQKSWDRQANWQDVFNVEVPEA